MLIYTLLGLLGGAALPPQEEWVQLSYWEGTAVAPNHACSGARAGVVVWVASAANAAEAKCLVKLDVNAPYASRSLQLDAAGTSLAAKYYSDVSCTTEIAATDGAPATWTQLTCIKGGPQNPYGSRNFVAVGEWGANSYNAYVRQHGSTSSACDVATAVGARELECNICLYPRPDGAEGYFKRDCSSLGVTNKLYGSNGTHSATGCVGAFLQSSTLMYEPKKCYQDSAVAGTTVELMMCGGSVAAGAACGSTPSDSTGNTAVGDEVSRYSDLMEFVIIGGIVCGVSAAIILLIAIVMCASCCVIAHLHEKINDRKWDEYVEAERRQSELEKHGGPMVMHERGSAEQLALMRVGATRRRASLLPTNELDPATNRRRRSLLPSGSQHYAGTLNKNTVLNREESVEGKTTNVAVDGMQLSAAAHDVIKRASFRVGDADTATTIGAGTSTGSRGVGGGGGAERAAAVMPGGLESAAAKGVVAAGGSLMIEGAASGAAAGAVAGAGTAAAAAAAGAANKEGVAAQAQAKDEVPSESTLTPIEAADAAVDAALAASAKVERAVQSLARWGLIPTTEAQKIRFAKVKAEREGRLRPGSEVENAARASFAKESPPTSALDLTGASAGDAAAEAPAAAVLVAAAAAGDAVAASGTAASADAETVAAIASVGSAAAAELVEAVAEAGRRASSGGGSTGGWTEHAMDDGSGHVYYYNEATGETLWERPGESVAEASAAAASAAAAPATEAAAARDTTGDAVELPVNWTSHVAELGDATGHTFYSNSVTGEVSWTPPALDGHLPAGHVDGGLPEGWEKVAHDDGGHYYYHAASSETQWEAPTHAG